MIQDLKEIIYSLSWKIRNRIGRSGQKLFRRFDSLSTRIAERERKNDIETK